MQRLLGLRYEKAADVVEVEVGDVSDADADFGGGDVVGERPLVVREGLKEVGGTGKGKERREGRGGEKYISRSMRMSMSRIRRWILCIWRRIRICI